MSFILLNTFGVLDGCSYAFLLFGCRFLFLFIQGSETKLRNTELIHFHSYENTFKFLVYICR